jgi:hypothetical protein
VILLGSKSVTVAQPATLNATRKPLCALFGTAVRKRMRDGEPPRLFLQSVVTDRGSGDQRLLEIALFENVELLMSMVCPDTPMAVGLQSELHLELILSSLS